MESTNPNNIFAEYTKLITQFKLPGVDVARDPRIASQGHRGARRGQHDRACWRAALGQKQMEILRSTMTELQSLVTRLQVGSADPPPATGEGVQQALQKALVDMQELADTAYRAQADSIAVVTKRVAEHVEELKALLQPKK